MFYIIKSSVFFFCNIVFLYVENAHSVINKGGDNWTDSYWVCYILNQSFVSLLVCINVVLSKIK